jgi:predicted regulator of amino acid metabolism with ACT domain
MKPQRVVMKALIPLAESGKISFVQLAKDAKVDRKTLHALTNLGATSVSARKVYGALKRKHVIDATTPFETIAQIRDEQSPPDNVLRKHFGLSDHDIARAAGIVDASGKLSRTFRVG